MSNKNTSFLKNKEMICGDKVLDLSEPRIMGILNLTQDSFYDGGKHTQGEDYLHAAEAMIAEGAHIIDVGAASTRPGAKLIDEKQEWDILYQPLVKMKKAFPDMMFSVDTYNASQIAKCADLGVHLINDISGGSWDQNMFSEIAKYSMAYVMMHIQGKPENMQNAPSYHSVIDDVVDFFAKRIKRLKDLEFHQIIIDPGFGFGKSLGHNFELLAEMNRLTDLGCPVLAGLSRKSMIFRSLDISPQEALNGTSVLNTLALQNGADILRVHDIKEANETIKLVLRYKRGLKNI